MRDYFPFLPSKRSCKKKSSVTHVTGVTGSKDLQNSAHCSARREVTRALHADVTPVTPSGYIPPGPAGDESADWIAFYDERAAIRQYDAAYDREMAERLAFGECIEAWCERHPVRHDPALCAGCGRRLGGDALDLADGARVHWADGDFICLMKHGHRRKRRALNALLDYGLRVPAGRSVE